MASSSELVDVVDQDDQVVRVATRAEVRAGNLLHRCTFVVVLASDGRLLVHQRSPHKDVWPSRWDITVGGVLTSGEKYPESARREVAEEIGLTDDFELEWLGKGVYEDQEVRVIGHCFKMVHDGPYVFADGEVVATRLVDLDEVSKLLQSEQFVPDSIEIVVPLLAGKWREAFGR